MAGIIGNAITATAGLGLGFAQRSEANKLKADANKLTPALEDNRTVALLEDIKRKAKTFATGTDSMTQGLNRDIDQQTALTQGNIVKSSKGDARVVQEGLKDTFEQAVSSKAKVASIASDKAFQYDGLTASLVDKIGSRSLDIKMSQKAQALREAAELKKSSNTNIAGAIPSIAGIAGELT